MFEWKYCLAAGAFALVWLVTGSARAVTIISTVGDRDGFNGIYNPDTQSLPFRFNFFTVPDNSASDDVHTDRIYFEENEGATYAHRFTLPTGFTITSAQYEIVTYDNASEAQGFTGQNGNIFLDGVELHRGANQDFFYDAVGELYGGADMKFEDGAAEKFVADIPSSMFALLADGSVDVHYIGQSVDNVAVDYSRIIITGFVPEPSGAALLAAGAALVLLARRRRR